MSMYCLFHGQSCNHLRRLQCCCRRRQILLFLAHDERQVGEIVTAIGLDQPSVSKHLGVLRRVNLVRVRRNGRHRLYRTNAAAIQPLHQWTETFERYWQHQLTRVKERAERVQAEIDRGGNPTQSTIPKH
jgi:DNA-binding transcriptional ArsR family regulator